MTQLIDILTSLDKNQDGLIEVDVFINILRFNLNRVDIQLLNNFGLEQYYYNDSRFIDYLLFF